MYDIGIFPVRLLPFRLLPFAYFRPKSGVLPTHLFYKNKPISGCHFDIALMHKYHFVKSRRNAMFWAQVGSRRNGSRRNGSRRTGTISMTSMVTCLFSANRLCTCLFVVGGVVVSIAG